MIKDEDLVMALERSFLASEFLTWVWFRCETEGGTFDLPGGEIGVAVEDALALTSWQEEGLVATVRGGSPTRRPEAANALGAGLLLRRARFIIARGTREWSFALDGMTLDLSGIKIADPDADDEPEDVLVEKLAAGEQLRELVDLLYAEFLSLRLGPDWEQLEVKRLRDWVEDKLRIAAETTGVA